MNLYVNFALIIVSSFLAFVTTAHVLDLEVRPARPLAPDSTRGFHHALTIHEQDTLGGWTARFHQVQLHGGIVAVGEYYARIKLGGQTIRVQIDTGSATLAVPMAECDSCKKGDMRYNITKSDSGKARIVGCDDDECQAGRCSSFMCGKCSAKRACCATSDEKACAFHLSFGDGSGARGVLVNDVLEWGDVKFPVTFGGIRHDSPDFERKQVDGILGMAYPRLACNPSCVKPAFESARDYLGLRDMFTICMTDDDGTITLGAFDDRVNITEVTYVPMHFGPSPSFYSMRLLGNLQIGERELVLPSYYKAIVDSGTTLVVFSKPAFAKFLKHLQTYYCHIPGLCDKKTWFRPAHCVKIADEDRHKLPKLVFQLEGFNISLDSNEYMINYKSKGPEYWCVGVMALNSMSGGVDVIFGNTVMKKYLTIYDRVNKRIGFAESGGNCKPKNMVEMINLPVSKPPQRSHLKRKGLTQQLGEAKKEETETKPPTIKPTPHAPVDGYKSSAALCGTAKSCGDCVKLAAKKCFWDTPLSACVPGEPTKLMCVLDSIAGNLAYFIAGLLACAVIIIIIILIVMWIARKRRLAEEGQRVDPVEQDEALQPLAGQAHQSEINEIFG